MFPRAGGLGLVWTGYSDSGLSMTCWSSTFVLPSPALGRLACRLQSLCSANQGLSNPLPQRDCDRFARSSPLPEVIVTKNPPSKNDVESADNAELTGISFLVLPRWDKRLSRPRLVANLAKQSSQEFFGVKRGSFPYQVLIDSPPQTELGDA